MQTPVLDPWPALPLAAWRDTYETLHLYTQVVGKIRLALAPMTNGWWQVAFYVTARGLTSSPIPYGERIFQLDFDFFNHELQILTSEGSIRRIPLGASVKEFYREVFSTLQALEIDVKIHPTSVELPEKIRLDQDTRHATYDPFYAWSCWRVLAQVDRVFKQFRARFTGKCSPVHFFWGSFDLAVTRFSGRPAPAQPNADLITRLAYNEEVSSVGFWPGGMTPSGVMIDAPAFYSYFVPKPERLELARIQPTSAFYHDKLGEHLLMYEDVRRSSDPEGDILDFAQSVYDAGAKLAGWPDYTAPWVKLEQEAAAARYEAGADQFI